MIIVRLKLGLSKNMYKKRCLHWGVVSRVGGANWISVKHGVVFVLGDYRRQSEVGSVASARLDAMNEISIIFKSANTTGNLIRNYWVKQLNNHWEKNWKMFFIYSIWFYCFSFFIPFGFPKEKALADTRWLNQKLYRFPFTENTKRLSWIHSLEFSTFFFLYKKLLTTVITTVNSSFIL